jgi:hypothetical protein
MKKVIPEIIHQAQAAYVPGRDISFNNRLLSLAKKYCKQADEDFCIISLDAKKAFDSVSHVYLSKVLQRYDFPEEFIRSFNLIYNSNEAVVQVNGHLSEPFSIQRGVKQGDALSCSLFVLAVDPLIRNIAANQNIEGLQIPISVNESVEIKVMAYADDITIICRNANLQPVFSDYELLSVLSGLELNADKTEILNLIDSPRTVSNVMYLGQNYALGRVDYVKVCGIWIGDNVNVVYERNVQDKIKIMEGIILSWRRRFLSLNGRMILAKVFVLSQIVFVAQACAIKPKEIKKIEHLIYSFVNGNKLLYRPERIARKTLKAPKKEGGINGVDVDSFVKSIVLRQYVKALSNNPSLSAIQLSNTSVQDEIGDFSSNLLRTHYRKYLDTLYNIPNFDQILTLSGIPIRLLMCQGNRAFQLVREANFENLYSVQCAFANQTLTLTHRNMISKALPKVCGQILSGNQAVDSGRMIPICLEDELLEIRLAKPWQIKLDLTEKRIGSLKVDPKIIYKNPLLNVNRKSIHNIWSIKNPTLRNVRLKVLYKNIYSNQRRFNFRLTDSPACAICGEAESVEHQLLICPNAQAFWTYYFQFTSKRVNSFEDILSASQSTAVELVKSVILRKLIQIDRSFGQPLNAVQQECLYYLRLESIVNQSKKDELKALMDVISAA